MIEEGDEKKMLSYFHFCFLNAHGSFFIVNVSGRGTAAAPKGEACRLAHAYQSLVGPR